MSQVINCFSSSMTAVQNKLECLPLEFFKAYIMDYSQEKLSYPREVPHGAALYLTLSVNVRLA